MCLSEEPRLMGFWMECSEERKFVFLMMKFLNFYTMWDEFWGTLGRGCAFPTHENAGCLRRCRPLRFPSPLPTKQARESSSSTFHSTALFQIEMERVKCVWFPFLASFTRCFGNLPSEILTSWESVWDIVLTWQLFKILAHILVILSFLGIHYYSDIFYNFW